MRECIVFGVFSFFFGAESATGVPRRCEIRTYMCGYLTCPLCDDSSGYALRMCAVLLNWKRQLLAVLPQLNSSSLRGRSTTGPVGDDVMVQNV